MEPICSASSYKCNKACTLYIGNVGPYNLIPHLTKSIKISFANFNSLKSDDLFSDINIAIS